MARLLLYIPFTRGAKPSGDLRTNAAELASAPLKGAGAFWDEVVIVFLGEESTKDKQARSGDIVCVHAHGGTGKHVDLSDNINEEAKLKTVIGNLETLLAYDALAVYFFVCFSAERGHIATLWKSKYSKQKVFGSDKIAEGGIIYTTRTSIRSSVFTDGRLREL